MSEYKIKESVGEGGKNKPDDVIVIQTLLNKLGDYGALEVNGLCSDRLKAAIRSFQSEFMSKPDGRIDPGGGTLNRLAKIAKLDFMLLPQESGYGYYSYSQFARQYGTKTTIKMLEDVCQEFVNYCPNLEVGIGDISFRTGDYMAPHQTHKSGRNIDIRPLRKDGDRRGVTINDTEYSRDDTWILVELLWRSGNVKRILFNDHTIPGVTHCTGHDNHLHVEALL